MENQSDDLEMKFDDEFIDGILGFIYHNKSPFIRMTGESQSGTPLMWRITSRARRIKKALAEKQTVRLPYSEDGQRKYEELERESDFKCEFYPLVLDDESEPDLMKFYKSLRESYCEKDEFLVVFVIDSQNKIRTRCPCPVIDLSFFMKQQPKTKTEYQPF